MKILIIGGVAGGASVAARLRRLDESAEIIIFEQGDYISYANCGLPYYIGDTIKERDNLFVQTPEKFNNLLNVDVRINSEVISINPEDKTIEIDNKREDKRYTENYDKLVLSPGAEAFIPTIPGIDHQHIFTMRDVTDTDNIKNFIDNNNPSTALIMGGGFIGLEMAENLTHLGISVTLVEALPQLLKPLDEEMVSSVHLHLQDKGVNLRLATNVTAFKIGNNGRLLCHFGDDTLEVDMVIISIGVRPRSTLAKEIGLTIGEFGGIAVNDYMQTSNPDIYAIGDAVEVKNILTNKPHLSLLAGPANKQGRLCADNIVRGNTKKYKGTIDTAIAKVFDLTVATTGLNENQLKANNIAFNSVIVHDVSHAGYYPKAKPYILKLLFEPNTGKILGAQSVGNGGVDKRIDVIAGYILNSANVYELGEHDHAYAPPYSSAKDAVILAAFMAQNVIDKLCQTMTYREYEENIDKFIVLDVRTDEEVEIFSFPHKHIHIPQEQIRNRIDELPKDKSLLVICTSGKRSYFTCRLLANLGYDVYNFSGGLKVYRQVIEGREIINNSQKEVMNNMITNNNQPIQKAIDDIAIKITVDACGMQCPGPIIKAKKNIDMLQDGEIMKISATDPAFPTDITAWANVTGNTILNKTEDDGIATIYIQKGSKQQLNDVVVNTRDEFSMVVFSDSLDRALAAFILANGAASMGKKATLFFTFWGLNILKKPKKPAVYRDFMAKMFNLMLPSSTHKLKLSQMNMAGLGAVMMRKYMKKKNVQSLEELMQEALNAKVSLQACRMSMDLMGVKESDLMDGIEYAGVGGFLGVAEKSNTTLFI